jgi:hypothetical protein
VSRRKGLGNVSYFWIYYESNPWTCVVVEVHPVRFRSSLSLDHHIRTLILDADDVEQHAIACRAAHENSPLADQMHDCRHRRLSERRAELQTHERGSIHDEAQYTSVPVAEDKQCRIVTDERAPRAAEIKTRHGRERDAPRRDADVCSAARREDERTANSRGRGSERECAGQGIVSRKYRRWVEREDEHARGAEERERGPRKARQERGVAHATQTCVERGQREHVWRRVRDVAQPRRVRVQLGLARVEREERERILWKRQRSAAWERVDAELSAMKRCFEW